MNSGTVLAGTDGFTTMTLGTRQDARDWRDVADEIEIELVVERRVDRVVRTDHEAACSRPAAHSRPPRSPILLPAPGRFSMTNLLAEPLRQPLPIRRARMSLPPPAAKPTTMRTGRDRIGLRPRNARHSRQRGSARGQMQKLSSAGKFHCEPPFHAHSITSSARASSVGGTSRPSALAVLRLMTSSNLVDCKTGRSAGFAPLRIWPV